MRLASGMLLQLPAHTTVHTHTHTHTTHTTVHTHPHKHTPTHLPDGVPLVLSLLESTRVPHLQLLDGREESLVGGGHFTSELSTDTLWEAGRTQPTNQCADVLGTPFAVKLLALGGGALFVCVCVGGGGLEHSRVLHTQQFSKQKSEKFYIIMMSCYPR